MGEFKVKIGDILENLKQLLIGDSVEYYSKWNWLEYSFINLIKFY